MKNIKTKNIVRMIYILLVCTLPISVTFSKYRISSSGTDTVTVATIYADVHDDEGAILKLDLSDLAISQEKSIDFNIVNYTTWITSDVTLEYEVQLVTTGNLPLTYTLTARSEEFGSTDSNTSSCNQGTMIHEYTFSETDIVATGGEMKYGENTEHQYTLNISWDDTATDVLWTNEVDAVQVRIVASQKMKGEEMD